MHNVYFDYDIDMVHQIYIDNDMHKDYHSQQPKNDHMEQCLDYQLLSYQSLVVDEVMEYYDDSLNFEKKII
jgi:hypothetical protein